mgnify:CR=1 FL=1|jgi:hypothetical protein|tara:strand:- start:611 stop:904 length:294 start_codon:yes stop_codon:yes gene_type:complete
MKLVTDTSKQAYKEIIQEGKVSTQKNNIMRVVNEYYFLHGVGMSLREICKNTDYEINAVSGRVNDLKKQGKLATWYKKRCPISKKTINAIEPARSQS